MSDSTASPPVAQSGPTVSEAVRARVAAIRKVFSDYKAGAVPWVLYENGTAVLLEDRVGVTDRNVLIASASHVIDGAASSPGTPASDFNVSIWKVPISYGRIVITMYPGLGLNAMTFDLSDTPPGANDQTAFGLNARTRKDQDSKDQKVAFVSVDPS